MKFPVANRTSRELLLGLEPEGDTVPIAPGQTLLVKAKGEGSEEPDLQIDIEDGLVSISMMCEKEVWHGDIRLK
jgi:hypothetical protein